MLVALGDDLYAGPIQMSLQSAGVILHTVRPSGVATGTAFICVADDAENAVTVASGANACLRAADLPALEGFSHLLMQLEIPISTVTAYAKAARAAGVRVVLNAAPACPLPNELLALVDVIVVNEGELRALSGAHGLLKQGLERLPCPAVVVTLGARGCVARIGQEFVAQPGFSVDAVDTTGAGDTFCGTLTAALAQQRPFPTALRQACAASALACTQLGAQSSVPSATDVIALLERTAATQGDERVADLRHYAGLPCTE
jgi:ribokinase